MTFQGYKCDGCKKIAATERPDGWIALERRGEVVSISTTLFTAAEYEHYCKDCAEKGIGGFKRKGEA